MFKHISTNIFTLLVIGIAASVAIEEVKKSVGLFTPVTVTRDSLEEDDGTIGIFSSLRRIKDLEPLFDKETKREKEIAEHLQDTKKQVNMRFDKL